MTDPAALATSSGVPGRDQVASPRPALRPEVDHVVGRLHDVEVVLDDDHRVAAVDEGVQHLQELLHVVEVEARRGLVEDVERAAGRAARQLARELHALGLAARERRRALAEPDVPEAHVVEGVHDRPDRGDVREDLGGLLGREREDVGDVEALVAHLERLAVVALAAAHVARDVDVGQEVHLDRDLPAAAAVLAAAALHVEREAPRAVAAHPRVRHLRHELADRVEDVRVRGRVAAGRASDRRLVDVDDLVEVLEPLDPPVRPGLLASTRRTCAPRPGRGCRSRASTFPSRRRPSPP